IDLNLQLALARRNPSQPSLTSNEEPIIIPSVVKIGVGKPHRLCAARLDSRYAPLTGPGQGDVLCNFPWNRRLAIFQIPLRRCVDEAYPCGARGERGWQ